MVFFHNRLFNKGRKISYSQCGEDLIVDFIMSNCLHLSNLSYLDIGAYHPTFINNTYLLYQKGASGVCVEPDPDLCGLIKRTRNRDICLNVGVGFASRKKADFYMMSCKTLSTFSEEEAKRYQGYGTHKIEKVVQIPIMTINDVILQYFPSQPNFISIDTEGLELDILKVFDFLNFGPHVFCVETLTYTEDKTETKRIDIIDLMRANGYFVYADTWINTIFVNTRSWKKRPVR